MKVVSCKEWQVVSFSDEGVVLEQFSRDDSVIKMIANKIALDVKGLGRIYFDLMDGGVRVRVASKQFSEEDIMNNVSSLQKLLSLYGKKDEGAWYLSY